MDKKLAEDLNWIDDDVVVQRRPAIDEFPIIEQRTVGKHIFKKLEENILVPIGLIATTACLTMGLVNLRRGNSAKQQFFMRGRVGFQLFTLAAMVFGVILTTRKKNRIAARRASVDSK